MPATPPSAVLFDWDNTLIDGWAGVTAALQVVFVEHGMAPWSLTEVKARVRGSVRDSFPPLFGPAWPKAAESLRQAMAALHLDHLAPMPGAADALEAATAWPCAVVSNKDGAFLRREVAHLGWDAYFGALVGAGDATRDKPHPDPIWHALMAIGVPAGDTIWYVGDTGLDMQSAKAAGCRHGFYGGTTAGG